MSIETQFAVLHVLTAGIITAGMGGWWLFYYALQRRKHSYD